MMHALALVLGLLEPRFAGADTTYGRIDGDLSLSIGAGTSIGPRGLTGVADLRLRFLETAGVFGSYEEGFGGPAEPTRLLVGGLELRPLFLGRWLQGLELQRSFGDLLVDSFGLEIGAFASQPQGGSFADRVGIQLGLGLELPLMARATGLWIGLHGGVRYSDWGLGRGEDTALDRALYLQITLAWHQTIATHLVDAFDRGSD